jgi:imidazolonepropionase-like amidohydrolase
VRTLTRREFTRVALLAVTGVACRAPGPAGSTQPTASPVPDPSAPPTAVGTSPGVLIRSGAFADGRARSAQRNVSLLIRDGRVAYLGPRDGEPDTRGAEIIDLAGLTILPGLVDCHAHLTGAGGADYLARIQDPEPVLLARATENARTLVRAGVLAARDVGAVRSLNVRIRDELRGRFDAPVIAAAGTWIGRRGRYVPFAVQVDSAEQLRDAALAQLDGGADLVKVAVDGATGSPATFTAAELGPTVDAVHARGKRIAGHAQGLGSRVAAEAGFDTVDHGYVIDRDTAARMGQRTSLVTTLSVPVAFNNPVELEAGLASLRIARDAGVRIATGTDFGGGPPRPGNYALEVELLVRGGLEPFEALAAATWVAGEVSGIAGAGTLTVGAPADLVVVDGDPLSDVTALRGVRAVFRDGRRVV